MSGTDIEDNDVEDTGIPLPRIADAVCYGDKSLAVTWAEGARAGQVDVIDLEPIIKTYKIFRPLRKDRALFDTVHLIDDGDAIAWGDGRDLELSAETLEELAEENMTPKDFVEFMKRHALTEEGIAAVLGYSRRQIGYFKTTGPIPRVVALACKGYDAEHPEHNKASAMSARKYA